MTNTTSAAVASFISYKTEGEHGDLVSSAVSRAIMKAGQSGRKRTLATLSIALIVAVGCIFMVIGTSSAEASSLPMFTTANALAAKQDTGVAGVATASVIFAAIGALTLFSSKR